MTSMTTALEPFSVEGFRDLVDQSLIGTVVFDAATRRVIYASRSLAEICGRAPEKMIGIEVGELVHPDDREAVRQRGRERADGTAPIGMNQLRVVRPDGTIRDVETQGALRTIDGRDLIVVCAIDVTERELGISADDPIFHCHELGLELPNPFFFLKHEYPKRAAES